MRKVREDKGMAQIIDDGCKGVTGRKLTRDMKTA